jgi:hypothetical protein
MRVNVRAMAMPANATGGRPCVEPKITIGNMYVIAISHTSAAMRE